MIYTIDKKMLLQQGDIFFPIPMILMEDLENVTIKNASGKLEIKDWKSVKNNDISTANAVVTPSWGIVASQNCDATRETMISLFFIGEFKDVTELDFPAKVEKVPEFITKNSRQSPKWFYLPPCDKIGFIERMAVDFSLIFQVPRDYLLKNLEFLRKGRLNEVAYEHYRESIAQYFRRYPYNEWYPLNSSEFEIYSKKYSEKIDPYEWQKG